MYTKSCYTPRDLTKYSSHVYKRQTIGEVYPSDTTTYIQTQKKPFLKKGLTTYKTITIDCNTDGGIDSMHLFEEKLVFRGDCSLGCCRSGTSDCACRDKNREDPHCSEN